MPWYVAVPRPNAVQGHRAWLLLAHRREMKQSMTSLQWLAEAEIGRLEKLFELPSPADGKTSAAMQERRAAFERIRRAGNLPDAGS